MEVKKEWVKEENAFRSHTYVNQPDDMVRVTLHVPIREWQRVNVPSTQPTLGYDINCHDCKYGYISDMPGNLGEMTCKKKQTWDDCQGRDFENENPDMGVCAKHMKTFPRVYSCKSCLLGEPPVESYLPVDPVDAMAYVGPVESMEKLEPEPKWERYEVCEVETHDTTDLPIRMKLRRIRCTT